MILKKSFEIKTIHKFRDEKLHVYKVSTSRNWMCRFYADGKYKVKSTLETNLSTAKQIAMDWHDELRFNQKHGIPIHDISFSNASEKFKTYQRNLVLRGERTERQAKDYEYRISMLSEFLHNDARLYLWKDGSYFMLIGGYKQSGGSMEPMGVVMVWVSRVNQ